MEGTSHIWRWQDLQNKGTKFKYVLGTVIKIYILVSNSFQLTVATKLRGKISKIRNPDVSLGLNVKGRTQSIKR